MSVLRIYQNPVAINANRNLSITGMAISKSLERLSSGLRINRAADDAAGLSISEKLRAQIRGLNRASANALDGISLIQTAEGALNEVHSILQRMRELAVQASNGIYTADDRAALQLEISQLTDEINRIAASTEFNTKKLLDGTLGALVSTDDFSRVQAAVTGNVGNGGNFVMQAVAKSTGQLQAHKTDVFATERTEDAVGQINYLRTFRADAVIKSGGVDGVGNTGIYQAEVPVTANGSLAVNSPLDGRVSVYAAEFASIGNSIGMTFQSEEMSTGDKLLLTLNNGTSIVTASVVLSPGLVMSAGAGGGGLAEAISIALTGAGVTSAVAYNAGNGTYNLNLGVGVTVVNSKFEDADGSGSDFYLSFASDGSTSNELIMAASIAFVNNGITWNPAVSTASTGGVITVGDATTGQLDIRFDTRYSHWASIAGGLIDFADVIGWERYTGGNSFQEYGKVWQDGPAATNGTFLVSAITNRTYAVFEFNNAQYTSLVAANWDQDTALAASRGARLDDTLGNNTFSISAAFEGATGGPLENVHFTADGILQAGETATFNLSTNNVLTADQLTTLASINRFQDFGVFLGTNSTELTLYVRGSDNRATITVSRNDTLEDVAGKISLAIWNPDGTGVINSGVLNGQMPPDLVHVNTYGLAKGTISITTPVPGAELVIAGNEALQNALSLMEIRESTSPIYSVTAFNLEKGQSVGSVITDSNEITGLLPGLRIYFDNTLGLRLDPQPPTELDGGGGNTMVSFAYELPLETPQVSLSGVVESFFIHVVPTGFNLQIGANQGQLIGGFIADHSAKSLGVEGLLITESRLAQEAISIIDVAINRVSDMRSRLGAIQNRLEATIRNLDIAGENLTSAESRIRDADVAYETMIMTRNQILLQAGVAALAQANQLPQAVLQLLG